MKVKILKNEDWKQFRILRLEALKEHPEAFGSSFEEEVNLSDEEFEINFKKSTFFGVLENNNLVACAGFFTFLLSKMKHKGVVFSMYTKRDYRNLRIADALLKSVITHAKKLVIQLHLTVVTSNHVALKLYQNNGFRVYGTEHRALKIGEQFHDEHLMVLDLDKD
ncbi:MAG: GNAT family N-acetyltransferase [Tatlockia sp.]|nr:GNAT family N-acetyltransferase [Tatlockia sp.]